MVASRDLFLDTGNASDVARIPGLERRDIGKGRLSALSSELSSRRLLASAAMALILAIFSLVCSVLESGLWGRLSDIISFF